MLFHETDSAARKGAVKPTAVGGRGRRSMVTAGGKPSTGLGGTNVSQFDLCQIDRRGLGLAYAKGQRGAGLVREGVRDQRGLPLAERVDRFSREICGMTVRIYAGNPSSMKTNDCNSSSPRDQLGVAPARANLIRAIP